MKWSNTQNEQHVDNERLAIEYEKPKTHEKKNSPLVMFREVNYNVLNLGADKRKHQCQYDS